MKKFFKDLGIYIVIFTTIAGGIWLIRGFQESSLDTALHLMGDKLAEMVADTDDRQRFATAFEQFMQRVLNNEISPDQVEQVAANILNLSNKKAKLSPEQAETILTYPEIDENLIANSGISQTIENEIAAADSESLITVASTSLAEARTLAPAVGHHPRDWKEVGEQLNIIFKTNEEMQKLARGSARKPRFDYIVRHDGQKGVCFVVADKPAAQKEERKIREKLQSMRAPHGKQLVIWEKNFSQNLHDQKRRIMHEMKILREQIERQNLDSIHLHPSSRRRWIKLARVKAIEAMTFDVNVDSIMDISSIVIESGKRESRQ